MKINLTRYPGNIYKNLLPRDVWVWVPPQYHVETKQRFPVIFMHDGQNLFYPEKAYTQITWGVAEAITRLSGWGFIQPAIVVGIDNTDNRIGDYMPTRPFETPAGKAYLDRIREETEGQFDQNVYMADDYLEWMTTILKPQIDKDFRTRPGPQHTLIMGSSMGGLISLYALLEYPEVFGGAGCFSTHWPPLGNLIQPYLRKYLPAPGRHRIYFDLGTGGGDAIYPPYQQVVDQVMAEKGYSPGRDWITRVAPGAEHHESAWRRRFHIALRFFLGRV